MNITFLISYVTDHDQLHVRFSDGRSVAMRSMNGVEWFCTVEFSAGDCISYRYATDQRTEWGSDRTVTIGEEFQNVIIEDRWRDQPADSVLYTSAFREIFWKRNSQPSNATSKEHNITVQLYCPGVLPSQDVVMAGNTEALGNWSLRLAPRMNSTDFPLWRLDLRSADIPVGSRYKFVIVDRTSGNAIQWQEGEDRIWSREFSSDERYILGGEPFGVPSQQWRGAGVAIPLFSLRSEQSAGIGDFADLARFAKWTASIEGRVVQILPVNDTTITHTWRDSYPYNAISTYALNPMYLSLESMGVLQDVDKAHSIADRIQRLNSLDMLDFEGVDRVKWDFFHAMYAQEGRTVLQSDDFRKFYNANESWLKPYAVFCFLRDFNGTADFSRWDEWSVYDPSKADHLLSLDCAEYDRAAIYLYLQYYADKQLRNARAQAASFGVALKGDIPIGISRHSVEAWVEPHLFNLDSQAGAPPDDFSVNGQNWGFPTYNWDEMAKDNYAWWRKRFKKMADYFDLYRIDHILGFFRIWQIPLDSVQGLTGQFSPALPFSREELQQWDLPMDDSYLTPYINKQFPIESIDISHARRFLNHVNNGVYRFKPEFDTQRKIAAFCSENNIDDTLRDGLFDLMNDVLFVRDARNSELFHPRIDAQKTSNYRRLSDYQKWRFNELYNHFFYHRHNAFWADKAIQKLPVLINSTDMMCCAEDLGMIPDCVPDVLGRLRVITLEVERMSKISGERFGHTDRYPYLSVCTTSTHDMSPLRLWWAEDRDTTQYYYNSIMRFSGDAPKEASTDICAEIVNRHLASPSILAILPLQDWLSLCDELRTERASDEQINVPSNANHYWRYRMPVNIEELESKSEFVDYLRTLIAFSGRTRPGHTVAPKGC